MVPFTEIRVLEEEPKEGLGSGDNELHLGLATPKVSFTVSMTSYPLQVRSLLTRRATFPLPFSLCASCASGSHLFLQSVVHAKN